MARVKHIGNLQDREKEFMKLFDRLTYSRSAWQVWEDLMTVMACSICNAVDRREEAFARREEQYKRAIKELGGVDIPAEIFGIVTMALEDNPNQDFLGKLYMNLNLGNHWKGQFVCDPYVGAGAMLIAAAQAFRDCKINYQTCALFIGQDIDPVVAKMAYIQLSLLGCPGYIIVGDSILNPPTGHVLFPQENNGQELWITPLFMHQTWEIRRTGLIMQELFRGTATTEKTVEKEHYYMFFDFDEKEDHYGEHEFVG